MTQAYIILVVEVVKSSVVDSVQRLRAEHPELGEPHIVLLTTQPNKYSPHRQDLEVIACDFEPDTLQRIMDSLPAKVAGVVCRGDVYVQFLRKLVPYLPPDVPIASERSLRIATNKRLMREAFAKYCPENTPQYVRIHNMDEVSQAEKLTFPIIIKPANLASSLLIQKCDDAAQLRRALEWVFKQLPDIYRRERRTDSPEVIVEEFMHGDLYSIDSYVLQPGEVYHTPLVYYVAAQQLGIDDFFLYKRTTPVDLPKEAVYLAQRTAANAIAATGLQYTSVHTELIRLYDGSWKIIELGPRLGRFRNVMYREAFGIDHGYNDLLVHCGLTPKPTPERTRYCAAYSIYPEQQGVLRAITGIEEIESHLRNVVYTLDMHTVGAPVHYARNGGHSLYELIFTSQDKREFASDIAWFEANVHAVVEADPTTIAIDTGKD